MSQVIALASRRRAAPRAVLRKVPRRRPNADYRTHEHLEQDQVDKLLVAARNTSRNSERNYALLLLMHRHGLRVSEAVALRWEQVNLKAGTLHVNRVKNGIASTHPLRGPEIRALRKLKHVGPYVFTSELGGPMTTSNVQKLIAALGASAGLTVKVHPHMLRHSIGYRLAAAGHDTRAIQQYLGHASINSTTRYMALDPNRFKTFFRD